MFHHKMSAAVAVVAIGTLLGCDSRICVTCIEPPPVGDTTPPVVTSVNPADGAKDVSVTAEVTVGFSESVDPTTVNLTTFKVMNGALAVAGSTSSGSPTATFKPTENFEYSTTYTAVVSGVKDMAGNMLQGEYRWSFTTTVDPTLWMLPTGYQMFGVAANESSIHVIGGSTVAGFDSSGKRKWFVDVAGADYCGVAVLSDVVYLGRMMRTPGSVISQDVYVDARDVSNGALLWSTPVAEEKACATVTVSQQSFYIVVAGFGLVELSTVDGRIVRTLTKESFGGNETGYWSVAVDDSTVYLGGTTFRDLEGGAEVGPYGDFFLAAFDRQLTALPRWVKQWTNSLDAYEGNVALAPNANTVYLAGYSGLLVQGDERGGVLLAYSRQGEFRW